MEQAQSEREIIGLEHAYWRAIQERDVDAAMELTDEHCVITGAQGYASIERAEFARMMKSERWQLRRYELVGEPAVRFPEIPSAVTASRVRRRTSQSPRRMR